MDYISIAMVLDSLYDKIRIIEVDYESIQS